MSKFLQCHRQFGAPRKRSVPSVNDHPAIVDRFRKFYENGPYVQTTTFRVTMVLHKAYGFPLFSFIKIGSSTSTFHYFTRELFWYKRHLICSNNSFNVSMLVLQNLLNPSSLLIYIWLERLSTRDFRNSSLEKCLMTYN